ncbi:U3 small nucleolar ribonucleoprotein (snoRNP) subunit - Mpp10p [Trachipleistophora hominis]|uniref:U3 small nucleolar ribonucleoprotein (snoRNP) subunit-Mpp10p n=1 Tax=Trachipleistophora hominis TaxID=72359 RepID=L7JTR4_TRAHO|nr:U3 small nucleolar ribonucleoprotein (snoRNP) subunit - Mpp10p [Trachipleistophora hominis]
MYKGEASARERPLNSLLGCDLEFKQTRVVTKPTENDENETLMLVKTRLREKNLITFYIQ